MNTPILTTEDELALWRKQKNVPINLIPTMGALHQGHRNLIKFANKSKISSSQSVLVSIFVNPLQFGPEEDFTEYPRNLSKDCELAFSAGAHAVWAPSLKDVFPKGADSYFKLNVPNFLQNQLCGSKRKGHFNGVASVVIRLLSLAKPNILTLGEKDWQQLTILRRMIKELGLNIKILGAPTYRESDGLACSSRNSFLNPSEREKATCLPKALELASKQFQANGSLNINSIKMVLENNNLNVEYLEAVDPESLQPIENQNNPFLLAAAVRCGKTRLIDHTFLMTKKPIVAIDGPAGAGKSTVTKAFAKQLGLLYLDTGAMYRALTWLIKEERVDPSNPSEIESLLIDMKLELKTQSSEQQNIIINEKDVTSLIRTPEITKLVPEVASHECVREMLSKIQKEYGIEGGVVAEGRDIGSTIFPNANLKIFLTATPRERAIRRANDFKERGFKVPELEELEDDIRNRDLQDSSRKIAPLVKAKDAKEIYTDGMSIEEVVETLVDLFRLKIPEEIWPTP